MEIYVSSHITSGKMLMLVVHMMTQDRLLNNYCRNYADTNLLTQATPESVQLTRNR